MTPAVLARKTISLARILAGGERVREDTWGMGLVKRSASEVIANWPPKNSEIAWIKGPKNGYWADPFVVEGPDKKLWVFCEEYLFNKRRGTITAVEVDPQDGRTLGHRPIMEQPFHLSYPFVFQHQGRWYGLPEQFESNRVQLYEITDFPGKWVPSTVLIPDFKCVDPTLHFDGTTWWLFINQFPQTRDTLYIYHAQDLHGPWVQHPGSPWAHTEIDMRMAGLVWADATGLYRVAQDSSTYYGDAMWLKRIHSLDHTTFEEENISHLQPSPEWPLSDGCHHISTTGTWTAFDTRGKVMRRANLRERRAQLLARLRPASGA